MQFHRFCLLTFSAAFGLTFPLPAQDSLRVSGSTTLNPVVSEAVEVLRNEKGLRITIDTAGGSTGGINALGDGRADVAMSSRSIQERDRDKFPSVKYHSVPIGQDAVSLVVSADVWNGGVKNLSGSQIRDLYEGRLKNWKEVGGPDRRVVFLNREPGRGEWEVFTRFLYPDRNKPPMTSHPMVGSNEETRNKTGGTRGAITFLSTPWADGKKVFALGLELPDGNVVEANGANIASGQYPMSRPLFVITDGEPAGAAATLIDYLLAEPGQQLVSKHGYLRLDEVQ